MADDVFAALADPTRRRLYGRLAERGPSSATLLATELDISRQAVAKHLGILAGAGMATSARVGRETRFTAEVDRLDDVRAWLSEIEGQWARRLTMLADSLHSSD